MDAKRRLVYELFFPAPLQENPFLFRTRISGVPFLRMVANQETGEQIALRKRQSNTRFTWRCSFVLANPIRIYVAEINRFRPGLMGINNYRFERNGHASRVVAF